MRMTGQATAADAAEAGLLQTPWWADAPPTVREVLAPADNLADAEARTRRLAHRHYENFSVVSFLLPRHLRQDFCNLYAFCRAADDLGDEVGDCARSLDYLGRFKEMTRACHGGSAGGGGGPSAALFLALAGTIGRHDLPAEPFLDLIDAFEQDQRIGRYETFDQLVDYCRRSADPVGRLVLYLCGYRDARRQHWSDRTCTALQLANFWQGVRGDLLERGRIYIPQDSMERFGVTEEQIRQGRYDDRYRQLMRFEVDRTEALFAEGENLLPTLNRSVRGQIGLFGRGGRAILQAIRACDYDTLRRRPSIPAWRKGSLILAVLAGRLSGAF